MVIDNIAEKLVDIFNETCPEANRVKHGQLVWNALDKATRADSPKRRYKTVILDLVAPQDIELFDGSIAENIARFAKVDPSVVIEAATRTGIHDMILRLPKGYDTSMGEAGSFLSGGQRQRIGLARAILGDPALIVLDEPSANLDDIGEAALIRTVRELKGRGKTVFMIVHQQHLLAAADRVLILDNGLITNFLPVVAPKATAQQSTSP